MTLLRPVRSAVLVRAPSNIALIKYMGKKTGDLEVGKNLPENASLSMTLSNLCTYLEISGSPENVDVLLNQKPENALGEMPELSDAGKEKFLKHIGRFREMADELSQASDLTFESLEQKIALKTSNTFPHSAGIASSASSFAALSLACFYYFVNDRERFRARFQNDSSLREVIARFSRLGSGSSCRSFFGPFCSWHDEKVSPTPSSLPDLVDLVLVVSHQPKEVGSSEAHARVKTAQAWSGRAGHPTRPERANARFHQLARAVNEGNFGLVSTLAYDDFIDMHELFQTSHPPFTYMTTESKNVVNWLETQGLSGLEFITTMDAGPNIHVLVPKPSADALQKKIETRFPDVKILRDVTSLGPEIL